MAKKEKAVAPKPKVAIVQPKAKKEKDVSPKASQDKKPKKVELNSISVICNCGNKFKTLSTSPDDLKVEICSACHPLYTGTQKLIDTTGQVEKYKERLAKMVALKKQRSKKH